MWLKIFLIIAINAILSSYTSSWAQEVSIIPKPTSIVVQEGVFSLSNNTCLIAGRGSHNTSDLIRKRLELGLSITLNEDNSGECANNIKLEINTKLGLVEEAYVIVIDDNISIKASSESGLFYGVQSLLQLMPPEVYGVNSTKMESIELPKVSIQDEPRFKHRGLMIDISRHFMDKQEIIKTIDMMAMHKLNVLHIHLTDDHGWRIEIKSYPKLTSIGAIGDFSNPNGPEKHFLTQDDIREIVAFAATRHVMVIPEIEMPGHTDAARKAYPEFFGQKVYNPANPETYVFIEKIMDEVIGLFPAPYFHIGGDEVGGISNWLNMPDVQGLMKKKGFTTESEIEGYFDQKVTDMLVSKGKRPMGWEEVVNFDVSKKTVIQWWLGHLVPSETLRKAFKNGHNVVMSPNWYVYWDYAQAAGEPGSPWNGNINGPNSLELIYEWEPISDSLSTDEEALVLGIEAPLWTQFMKTRSFREYMIYPRLAALAEINWIPKNSKNLEQFHVRMKKQYERYKASEVNYRAPGWTKELQYITH
ncbi:MAG: beta-N-acetylhexosaminidase [Flavobacteriales bacterium]|nr:beta-N-acetylhexosaminidase [Flavobacteriales bacterium]